MYFESVFINSNNFYINIYNINLWKKFMVWFLASEVGRPLNLSYFNIWEWYLYDPVTLEKVMNFFVKDVIFRYFLTSIIFFPYLK